MVIIIHRCSACGHPDIFHDKSGVSCCYTSCRCAQPDFAPPEMIPTFSADPPWRVVQAITPPGTRDRDFGPLCGCDQCRELYERENR